MTTLLAMDEAYLVEGAGQSLTWGGRFIWKNPLDLFVYAEIVREVKPALVVETGTHQGGSALFWADMLSLYSPPSGHVVTVDRVDSGLVSDERITYLVGDSTAPEILSTIYTLAERGTTLVNLDSDHSYVHVSQELEAYAPLVSPGSYLICEDGIDDERLGRKGVLAATRGFLAHHPEFDADRSRERYALTNCPEGFLRRRTDI